MKRLLALLLVIGIVGFSFVGCDDEAKERLALRAVKIAAMEYGYNARGWFEWGNDEQIAYTLIMTGKVNRALVEAIKDNIRKRFNNPIAAQGVLELIDEAGLQFNPAGDYITTADNYSLRFFQSAAEGFFLGVTAK